MAKNSVRDFDATAANNTDIQSVDIAENCAPSGINNAIRELMADIKNVSTGTIALESPSADSLTVTGDLTVDTNTLYVDSTNNRVGINDATPSEELDINGDGSDVKIRMYDGAGASVGRIAHSGANFDISNTATASATLTFTTGSGSGTERGRFDGSGNLLVGTTDTLPAANNDANGFALRADGNFQASRSGAACARFNRGTSDGEIMSFHKDGTTVGSIGADGGALFIGNDDAGIYFNHHGGGDLDAILPYDVGSGALYNGHVDIGGASNRFKNLYLSGGVYLGGTGSANKLDDYEEGTWTPTAGINVAALSGANAHYTKVGNLVTITFEANAQPTSTSSNMQFGGLPFTVVNHLSSTSVGATGIAYENNSFFTFWVSETTNILVIELDRPLQGSASTASKNYRGTLTYFTS